MSPENISGHESAAVAATVNPVGSVNSANNDDRDVIQITEIRQKAITVVIF